MLINSEPKKRERSSLPQLVVEFLNHQKFVVHQKPLGLEPMEKIKVATLWMKKGSKLIQFGFAPHDSQGETCPKRGGQIPNLPYDFQGFPDLCLFSWWGFTDSYGIHHLFLPPVGEDVWFSPSTQKSHHSHFPEQIDSIFKENLTEKSILRENLHF